MKIYTHLDVRLGLSFCWLLLALGACSDCSATPAAPAAEEQQAQPAPRPAASARAAREADEAAEARAALDAEFPLHGLVTGVQLRVREEPSPEATTLGWLRSGSRVRLAPGPTKTPTCATGFYRIHPRGYACVGEGIEVSEQPVESALAVAPPAADAPLPYDYYFVKEAMVPEYHRLPTRGEQRAAAELIARYLELEDDKPKRAAALMRGELEDDVPVVRAVRRYLDRGFYVAGVAVEEREARRFVRTVRGSYVQLAQLEPRSGSAFHGVEVDAEHPLPIAWAVRDALPFTVKLREDGTVAMLADEQTQPIPRHSILPWAGRERVGDRVLHKLSDGRYLKYWFVAVAEAIDPPRGIGDDEPWVHVNLEQQTMVLYRGAAPVYATLVSSGLPEHETPEGLFEIRQKYVANGMRDLGPEAGDERYSIDDVPWTQYFDGSIALHGAFWHERFGLPRSHGCVNLSPADAHRAFEHTWPRVPEGWHGVVADLPGVRASKVYVTSQ